MIQSQRMELGSAFAQKHVRYHCDYSREVNEDDNMLPFSVLRIWTLGLFSWIILGAGIYFLYEYADGMSPPRAAEVVVTDRDGQIATNESLPANQPAPDQVASDRVEVARAEEDRDTQGGWPYLTAALVLLGISFGGFLPVLPFLGKPKLSEPLAERTGRVQKLDRPDGSRLHVEIYGPENGPTIVLTHGWSLDSTAWYYLKKQFGERYRLVVWDLPGLGHSKGPDNRDYRIEKMADDLDAVIGAVAGDRKVILVGHSIGGMITQTFCRLYPAHLRARVEGIVLLHTTYTNPLRTAWLAPLWTALEKPLIIPLNHLTIWLAPLAWLSTWQSYLNGSLHTSTRFTSFAGDQTWGQIDYAARLATKAWPGVLARGNLAMLGFDEQASLPSVDVPVLIVGGEHDRMTTRQASDRLDQLAQGSAETTIPAGHLGFWEKNEQFAEILAEFVSKLESSKQPTSSAETRAQARAT